jgi:hypothetical protein
MNLTNKIGNISIKVEEIGLDIKIEGIEVSTTDINPVDYLQVIKAKKDHAAEVNKAIQGILSVIKEGIAQQAPVNPFGSSNPFSGIPGGLGGIKQKSAPSQSDLNDLLGALAKDLKEAAEQAKKEQGGNTPPFPFPGGLKF